MYTCMCAGSRYQAINIFWSDENREEANKRREKREKKGKYKLISISISIQSQSPFNSLCVKITNS